MTDLSEYAPSARLRQMAHGGGVARFFARSIWRRDRERLYRAFCTSPEARAGRADELAEQFHAINAQYGDLADVIYGEDRG